MSLAKSCRTGKLQRLNEHEYFHTIGRFYSEIIIRLITHYSAHLEPLGSEVEQAKRRLKVAQPKGCRAEMNMHECSCLREHLSTLFRCIQLRT